MQTKLYESSILNMIDGIRSAKVTRTQYDSILGVNYVDISGKPKSKLVFLDYQDFHLCIDNFFNNLITAALLICPNATREYIINLFKLAPYKISNTEKIERKPKQIKDEYEALEIIHHNQSFALVLEINTIKNFYLDKYIYIYDKIRDDYGDKLQKENKIFLCPYCQRNYVNVIQDNHFQVKADLDHFYPKAKYPFLASTLDNLVPTCQVCNSKLKKEIDFYTIQHLHPLKKSENIFKKLRFLYLGNKNIYIKGKAILSTREQQYIETFRIEEIYNTHTEVLDDILEKNKKYNYVKKNHILKTCPSMGMRTIKELVFHEYMNINENKVPMSSLKKSLFEKIVK